MKMQSPFETITDSSSRAVHSATALSTALTSNAFTSITACTPMARHTAAISTGAPVHRSKVAVPGWSWCPVMAVVRLSMMITVPLPLLCTMFSRGVFRREKTCRPRSCNCRLG